MYYSIRYRNTITDIRNKKQLRLLQVLLYQGVYRGRDELMLKRNPSLENKSCMCK